MIEFFKKLWLIERVSEINYYAYFINVLPILFPPNIQHLSSTFQQTKKPSSTEGATSRSHQF